jgi:diacylglycerol kinase (ATP)
MRFNSINKLKNRRLIDEIRISLTKSMTESVMESVSITSLSIPIQITLYGGVLLLLCFGWKLFRHLVSRTAPIWINGSGCHHWKLIGIITHTAYCSVCESLIVDGMYCDCCGTCADFGCHKKADIQFKCKTLSLSKSDNRLKQNHHWIHGNLEIHSVCDSCNEECDDESALIDWRCCWCQRTLHEKCFNELYKTEECDFGKWRACIVPPFCIVHKKVWSKGRRKYIVESVRNFEDEPNWKPLIVITNRKSGNNDGDKIISAFRAILNPLQVIDLCETSIESGLEWCELLAESHKQIIVRILVAAGDGTIGWTLDTIQKMKLDPMPFVGILPLGTGNDLSRVLGWGQSFSTESSIEHIMQKVLKAKVVELDRWNVKLTPGRSMNLGIPLPSKHLLMNNYFSVGVDALVALNFHETRKTKIYNYLFT